MDARTMRALAHPTRLALLEVLNIHPSLTATEASELIGISPTNCAFHLRTLGRYGFVEEIDTGPGRRRPWRIKQADIRFSDADGEAAGALADVMLDHWLTRVRAVQARRHSLPAEWQEALGGSQTIVYATPDETRQLVEDLRTVLSRYADRARDPDQRPDAAEPVEMLVFTQLFDALSS
ncbi:putative ArsR family transcriptional regulator [Hamadaea flava]|uniref:Helix-turn-helix domain-containing protein n=1 Tax=Hamadaea flava TaxID=1742688 RepID=A0ABV8LUF3_9ACTN|nr:helix-turn-helix domain-containing protein [Hamadaea flava]MCP2328208.1 putative ArsR family transcriptional regulator [Hamadaea flava]